MLTVEYRFDSSEEIWSNTTNELLTDVFKLAVVEAEGAKFFILNFLATFRLIIQFTKKLATLQRF